VRRNPPAAEAGRLQASLPAAMVPAFAGTQKSEAPAAAGAIRVGWGHGMPCPCTTASTSRTSSVRTNP